MAEFEFLGFFCLELAGVLIFARFTAAAFIDIRTANCTLAVSMNPYEPVNRTTP
jgi:hypothetical protein